MIHDIKQNFLTPNVYEIYSQCMYAPTYEKFAEKAHSYLNDPSTAIYGFYADHALLGIIVLQTKAPNTAEIVGIAVERSHQHKHIEGTNPACCDSWALYRVICRNRRRCSLILRALRL